MKHSVFFDSFPPPEFLQMPSAGMYISDKSIQFVSFLHTHHKDKRIIKSFGERALAPGVIDKGIIKKPKEVSLILESIKKSNKSLGFVRASLPEEEGYLVRMLVPMVSSEELREVVEERLENYVPMQSSEAIFDYSVISTNAKDNSLELEVSVVQRKIVEEYTAIFKGTGIMPISFEVESRAIARSVVPMGDKGVFVIVDIKEDRTGIYIVLDGGVRISSSIDIGAKDLMDGKEEIIDESKTELPKLKEEIEKRSRYWDTHKSKEKSGLPKVEGVYLCGRGASIKGLSNYFKSHIGSHVFLANPWVNAIDFDKHIPLMNFNESLRYSAAIGLAISDNF